MLPVKPWKLDAMARLFVSVFICVFIGSLLLTGLRYRPATTSAGALFYGGLALALGCLAGALVILRRPWHYETFLRRLTFLLLLFYGGLVLGMYLQSRAGRPPSSVAQIFVGGLSFQGAALLLVWRFMREHGATWNEGFGWSNRPGRALLLGFTIGSVFLPIGWALQWGCAEIVSRLPPQLHLHAREQETVQTLQAAATGMDWISCGVIIVLLVPPAEELLFRGILYPAVKQRGYPRLALWATALLFAAIHFNVVSFVPLTVLALILTTLYERTNNLLAPIAVHALFNAVNLGRLIWLQYQTGGVS